MIIFIFFIILRFFSPNVSSNVIFSEKHSQKFLSPQIYFPLSPEIQKNQTSFFQNYLHIFSMFSIPNPEKKMLDFDDFVMSPNLVLFDFDNIAPRSCFLPIRQSPRYRASSAIHCRLAQLSWVPFVDISAQDFEELIGNSSSGSKRKLIEDPLPEEDHTHSKGLKTNVKLQSRKWNNTNSQSKTKLAAKKIHLKI